MRIYYSKAQQVGSLTNSRSLMGVLIPTTSGHSHLLTSNPAGHRASLGSRTFNLPTKPQGVKASALRLSKDDIPRRGFTMAFI